MSDKSKLETIIKSNLSSVVDTARKAPSVHNTQPWKINISGNSVEISVDPNRKLDAGDPVGRQLWISMGCFTQAVIEAYVKYKLSIKKVRLKEEVIYIDFEFEKDNINQDISRYIEKRFTDRTRFSDKKIPAEKLSDIENAWKSNDVKIVVSDKREIISLTSELTARGIGLALSSPDFRNELSQFVNPPFSKRKVGIPSSSLGYPLPIQLISKYIAKLAPLNSFHIKRELAQWKSAAALVFVLSKGDSVEDWFEAGRAYLKSSLVATKSGLHQATSAAAIEALDYHKDIEKALGTKFRLQTIMRVGYSNFKPKIVNRLSTDEIIS